MTQNLSSSSLSTDKGDYDKQSSSEIRADIDQTRASVGEKIDQLQARLDPNRLKQQAQETVQEMLNDTASSMTEYVKTHRDEMVTSLADAARRNPLPTALVGIGIGWLILESMAGARPRQERRYEPGSGRAYMPQGDEAYYPATNWRPSSYDYPHSPRSDSGQSTSGPSYGGQSYGGQSYNPQSGQGFSQGYDQTNSQSYYQRSGESYNQESRPNYGNGHQYGENPLSKATGAVKDSVGDMTSRAGDAAGDLKDRAGDAASDLKDRIGDTMSDAKDRISGTVSDMTQRVSDMASNVKEHVGNVAGDMRDQFNNRMGDMRQQANDMNRQGQQQYNRAANQMNQWQQQARDEGQRRGQQVVRNLEDNPLIYGAVAMAAGAALALLLPQSRIENRAFGEMRDQVMEKGQDMLESAKGRAQQVFEDVRPELEQTANQIVSNVAETGKQAVKDAADQLSPVLDKAMTRGKEEALSAVQEVGIDPDKLTAGTSSTQSATSQSTTGQSSGSQSMGGQSKSGQSSTSQATKGQSSTMGQSSSSGMSGASSSSSMAKSSQSKAPVLNRDTLAGQWKQVKGEVKRKWGQLTDDDMTRIEGDYDKLVGAIQTRYGYTREQIDREFDDFCKSQTA
jgi:uncharacterized protein YjbJ (UPF0337 family)